MPASFADPNGRMQPPDEFRTERLRLRRIAAADAPALFAAYASDPEVTRYMSWRTHASPAETREFVDGAVRSWEDGDEFIWVLVPHDHDGPIGAVGAAPGPHGVMIGYVLGRPWWRRGLMSEALRPIMEWWRQQPDVHRIWAYCAADHERSARVLEHAGMDREALLRRWIVLPNLSERPSDALVYAWIRPEP